MKIAFINQRQFDVVVETMVPSQTVGSYKKRELLKPPRLLLMPPRS